MNRVGILIHGLHLQAKGWEQIVWGNPPHELGSLPKAVEVILSFGLENVGHVVFGTGASQKGGVKEAEYTRLELATGLEGLQKHPEVLLGPNRRLKLEKLISGSTIELEAQNTHEEITNAARHFAAHGCSLIVQIPTCASHAPRCVKTFAQVKARGGIPEGQVWMVAAPDTTFAGSTIDDVAIAEPPHRGDDPMLGAQVQTCEIVARLLGLPPLSRKRALLAVHQLLADEYEMREA